MSVEGKQEKKTNGKGNYGNFIIVNYCKMRRVGIGTGMRTIFLSSGIAWKNNAQYFLCNGDRKFTSAQYFTVVGSDPQYLARFSKPMLIGIDLHIFYVRKFM